MIAAERAKALPGADTVVLFDVSASMARANSSPWDTQEKIIAGITPTAMEYDEDGITVVPIFNRTIFETKSSFKDKIKDSTMAMEYVRSFGPNMPSTPTRKVLKKWLDNHLKKCIEAPKSTKRLNAIVVTDGEPTDVEEDSITATTERIILELRKHGMDPKEKLGMSYVIVTSSLEVMAGYRKLDLRSQWGTGNNQVECDLSNTIYDCDIKGFGGPKFQPVIDIILAANSSESLDKATEDEQSNAIMRIVDEYISKGFAMEVQVRCVELFICVLLQTRFSC